MKSKKQKKTCGSQSKTKMTNKSREKHYFISKFNLLA